MNRRLLDVDAYTTFDFLDARARGVGWTDEAVAVLDVDAPEDGGTVAVALELDPRDLDHVDHHADRLALTPAQARTLAAALEAAAETAETGESDESDAKGVRVGPANRGADR